jgi:hypothetical protein
LSCYLHMSPYQKRHQHLTPDTPARPFRLALLGWPIWPPIPKNQSTPTRPERRAEPVGPRWSLVLCPGRWSADPGVVPGGELVVALNGPSNSSPAQPNSPATLAAACPSRDCQRTTEQLRYASHAGWTTGLKGFRACQRHSCTLQSLQFAHVEQGGSARAAVVPASAWCGRACDCADLLPELCVPSHTGSKQAA